MDKIERIKKQFEQGNRWVEGNTDDIKQALRELGYRLSPKSEELPTLKDVFPAGGVPDEWAKAIEYYRAYLIGCGITQAKRLPSDKRESVAKKLAMIHLGKDWEDLDEEERALYLGDADEVIPLISSPKGDGVMDKLIEKIGNQQIVDISEKHKDNEENRLNLIPFARELLEYAIPIISEEIKKELERYGWFPDASGGHDPEWLARRNAWDNYWRKKGVK